MNEQACSNRHQPYRSQIPISLQDPGMLRALCRLILSIETDRLTVLLLSPAEEIIFCQEFYNDRHLSQEVFLRLVLENESMFADVYVDVRIYVSETHFTLIPASMYSEKGNLGLARLMLDDWAFSDEVQASELPGRGFHMLYLISPALRRLLREYIPHHRLAHQALPVLMFALTHMSPDSVVMRLTRTRALIFVSRNGQLQLFNQFTWQEASDLLYYLVACCKRSGLDLLKTEVICFSLEETSDVQALLETYTEHLIWQGKDAAEPGPARAKQIARYAYLAEEFRGLVRSSVSQSH